MGSVITAEREVSFREAVLDDLFDLFSLRKETSRHARYLPAMPFEQLLERALVTSRSRSDQNIICQLRLFHSLECLRHKTVALSSNPLVHFPPHAIARGQ